MNTNPNPPFLVDAEQTQTIDNRVPFTNFSTVRMRMNSVQEFLSQTLITNTLLSPDQLHFIVNGAALLSCSYLDHIPVAPVPAADDSYPIPIKEDDDDKDVGIFVNLNASDCEIVELDAVELLAKHLHFCEIYGKGFKRDANLRMHMHALIESEKLPQGLIQARR